MSERILSEFLATMPFHLFAYLPFYRHLRVKHWMLALILIIEEAASLLLMTVLINSGLNAGWRAISPTNFFRSARVRCSSA